MSSPTHRTHSSSISGKAAVILGTQRQHSDRFNPSSSNFAGAQSGSETQRRFLAGLPRDGFDARFPHQNLPMLNHSRSGSYLQTATFANERISTGPSILMSSMSSMPSLKQSSKKSGGIRASIKRMFGSKRNRPLTEPAHREYHTSAPGNLMATTNSPSPPRTQGSSRPRTAMQQVALGSHAVNPSSNIRDFDGLSDELSSPRKRRNTLPSLAFSDHEAQSFSERVGQLMEHSLRASGQDDLNILAQDKRRSKSAEALAHKFSTDVQKTMSRPDRESEIAFWRNSILLNPLPKSAASGSKILSREDTDANVKESPSLEHIMQPVQSFDFGLESAIPEPADLEERVNTLEVKMFDFEYAIAKLQGIELPKPILPTKTTKRKNIQEIYAKPSDQSLSTSLSSQEKRPITPQDSPGISPSIKSPFEPDRASKATTVRPLISTRAQLRASLRMSAEQFDTLMNMIQDEKDARQLMELQIIDLQREIELLQAPVYATINYPTPSSEATKNSAKQKKLHRSPPFQFHRPSIRETSRFSTTESETDSIDDVYEEDFQTPRERQHPFNSHQSSPLINVAS